MQKYQDVVLNQNGNPVSGVQVTVTDLAGSPVAVYSSNAMGLNVNPLTSDNNGRFSFYAPDGRYSLTFTFGGNVVASISDILLEDPMDGSDAVFNDVTMLGSLSDASKVTSAAVGGISATNVQDALSELDSDKASNADLSLKVNSADLSAPGGSALVGFQPAGSGAVKRWVQDKLRERVSVKDFGAKGDADPYTGSGTDDSAAIQAALYSQGSGGDRMLSVFLPDGAYYSSTDLIIPEGVTIFGNGAWRAKVHFATGKGFRMVSGGIYDFSPELYGLAVYSSGGVGLKVESISGASVRDTWFSGTTGIEIQGTADIAIHDNVFDGTANGIVFTAGSLCNNISIQNNSFTGNAYGITLKNARDVRITGNAFRGDANHNIHILSNNDSNTLIGVVISGNTFYTAPATGAAGSLLMKLNGTLSNMSITGNTMDGCRAQGIFCDAGSVSGVLIADNIISNTGGDAISFANTGTQVSIRGNIFRASIGGKALSYNVAGICTFISNEVYSANGNALTGINGAAVDVQQATNFVARGNTLINTSMTYGFSIRSTVVVENSNDNIISGATLGEYSVANNSWAPMKLTGPLNPGTIGAGSQPNGIWAGNGVPSNSFGLDGDWYMRTGTPGTANQRLYVKNAGAWSGIL